MSSRFHDRRFMLSEGKRNEVLALAEVEQYGRDGFGDPDYVQLYGLKPADWYARGIRILGRTAVECTRDRLADAIACDVAAVVRSAADVTGVVAVDPFAGSANTLFWIACRLRARCVGFELDESIFETSVDNLAAVGADVELVHGDYATGFGGLRVDSDELLIAFVAPPWGDALDETSGLDFRRTTPPVAGIVDLLAATFGERRVLVATQVYETTDPDSLEDVRARFVWSALTVYDIDPRGRNHGVLLGSMGWTPGRR